MRDPPKLRVHKGYEPVEGDGVAASPGNEERGHVRRSRDGQDSLLALPGTKAMRILHHLTGF
jgi:hypothetical protein